MAPLIPDPILAGFDATRAALENCAATFSLTLDIATFAVVIGVIAEFAALILEAKEEKRRAVPPMLNLELITALPRKYRMSVHARLSVAGCSLVALGVGTELWAAHNGAIIEGRLRKTNASEQLELIKRSNMATLAVSKSDVNFHNLETVVDVQDAQLKKATANINDNNDRLLAALAANKRALAALSDLEKKSTNLNLAIARQETRANLLAEKTSELESTENGLLSDLIPRAMNAGQLKTSLLWSLKLPIFITFVPEDEPRRFSAYLAFGLRQAGFSVTLLKPSGKVWRNGISVEWIFDPQRKSDRPSVSSWETEGGITAEAIDNALEDQGLDAGHNYNDGGTRSWEPCVPKDAILIRVGPKPHKFFDEKQIEQERRANTNKFLFMNDLSGPLYSDEACSPENK